MRAAQDVRVICAWKIFNGVKDIMAGLPQKLDAGGWKVFIGQKAHESLDRSSVKGFLFQTFCSKGKAGLQHFRREAWII